MRKISEPKTVRRSARSAGLFVLLGAAAALGGSLAAMWFTGRELQPVPRAGYPTATTLHFAPEPSPTAGPEPAATASKPTRARGVVLIIGDGMGISHLFAGRAALSHPAERLFLERLPVTGWLTTFAHASLYTDSAAAGTAMATGAKTAPFLLAISPEGRSLTTVAEAAHTAGFATGLITDTDVLDATPAAFVAHARRRDYPAVAAQTAAAGLTLLAGSNTLSRTRGADDDSFERGLQDHGMQVVHDFDHWQRALRSGKRVAGLFPEGSIADLERPPLLAALARSALERLLAEPGGFFLMVETEEVDTAAHRHDLSRVIGGVRALDAVTRMVVERTGERGDVLVIVTADHETGGLGLVGGTEGAPIRVRWATHSHTAEPVPLFAIGPGAEHLSGMHDNTEIARVIARALDLDLDAP